MTLNLRSAAGTRKAFCYIVDRAKDMIIIPKPGAEVTAGETATGKLLERELAGR
ncbi:MAG TPA: hypothetical protein VJT31_10950 [Rugosimonospora sp.]|nr:hypothetical protein [Rugosimonospora sp.]